MKDFGLRLKEARKAKMMNQKALGEAIGVGQTTIANYESGFRFPTGELLKKIGEVLNVSIDSLMGHDVVLISIDLENASYELIAQRFLEALLNDREQEAIAMIWQLNPSKENLFEIYNEVLLSVLKRIGEMWADDSISVATEHYASAVVMKVIGMLSTIPDSVECGDYSAVCMSLSAETHTIGIRMVSDYFRMQGVSSYYIGSTVPTDSLVAMLLDKKIDLLALSITMTNHFDALCNLVNVLRNHSSLEHLKIIVGGQGVKVMDEKDKTKLKEVDGVFDSFEKLGEWLYKWQKEKDRHKRS